MYNYVNLCYSFSFSQMQECKEEENNESFFVYRLSPLFVNKGDNIQDKACALRYCAVKNNTSKLSVIYNLN